MFFDFLPVDLLLKIFHQLPLKDRARLCGVNRSFRDASEESIAKMKSLVVDDGLMAYLVRSEFTFFSLLESCSPTLESIDATSINLAPFHSSQVSALAEFVYPKLKHLKIAVRHPTDNGHVKRLISRNQSLRSVNLHLDIKFEWPEDIIFEKMEKLDIRLCRNGIDLSPTVGPLIGMVPNLKHLTIQIVNESRFGLSAQEFTQLLASTRSLEELNLNLSNAIGDILLDFKTWHLPKLVTLYVNLNCPNPSSVLHHFPVSFPRLESFTSDTITEINKQALKALSQLKHLRELCLTKMEMTTTEIIGVITSLPSVSTLKINCLLLNYFFREAFIVFLTSTAAIFRRNLEICMAMCVDGSKSELEDVLEEMKNNDGPSVTYYRASMNSLCIESIRYKSLDG